LVDVTVDEAVAAIVDEVEELVKVGVVDDTFDVVIVVGVVDDAFDVVIVIVVVDEDIGNGADAESKGFIGFAWICLVERFNGLVGFGCVLDVWPSKEVFLGSDDVGLGEGLDTELDDVVVVVAAAEVGAGFDDVISGL